MSWLILVRLAGLWEKKMMTWVIQWISVIMIITFIPMNRTLTTSIIIKDILCINISSKTSNKINMLTSTSKMVNKCIKEINNNFIREKRPLIHRKNKFLKENVFVKRHNALKCIVNALHPIFHVLINVHVFLVRTLLSIKNKLSKLKCSFNKKVLLDYILAP